MTSDHEVKPCYEHDCTQCVFLGHKNGFDLYYCLQGSVHQQPTVIARYSSDGSCYKSGLDFAERDPELAEAKRRALAKGLRGVNFMTSKERVDDETLRALRNWALLTEHKYMLLALNELIERRAQLPSETEPHPVCNCGCYSGGCGRPEGCMCDKSCPCQAAVRPGVKCVQCNGRGTQIQVYDEEMFGGWSPEDEPCELCGGSGRITTVEQYLKTVPADWHEDSSVATWFPLLNEEVERLRAAEKNCHTSHLLQQETVTHTAICKTCSQQFDLAIGHTCPGLDLKAAVPRCEAWSPGTSTSKRCDLSGDHEGPHIATVMGVTDKWTV